MTRRNGRRALGGLLLAVTAGAVAPAAQAYYGYEFRPASSSDMCLAVEGWTDADFANVVQQTCWTSGKNRNQLWVPEHAGRSSAGYDYFRLKGVFSGKCLDVAGGSTADEANVQQYGCHWGSNQQWRFVYVGDGYYEVRARHSNKCLDVWWGTTREGENVQQYTCWGGAMQRWKRVSVFYL